MKGLASLSYMGLMQNRQDNNIFNKQLNNMKNLKFILSFAVILAISFTSCKKEKSLDVNNQELEDSYSQQIINKIIIFNEKMNSGLKTGEITTLDSAIWNTEASLNYNFAYPDSLAKNNYTKKSLFTITVNENNRVLMADVFTTYYSMEDSLIYEYDQIPNSSKHVIIADVKTDSIIAGTAYISVTTIYGIGITIMYDPFDEDDDWIWGSLFEEPEGKCDGTMVGVSDGSDELQHRLNHPKMETAYRYGFTDIEIVPVDYETCQYFEPENTKRVFNSINQMYCMQNNELTDYLGEYDYIIYTYNDTSNDASTYINVWDNEGARPEGKVFIRIQITDSYLMNNPITYLQLLEMSYGIPYATAPIE